MKEAKFKAHIKDGMIADVSYIDFRHGYVELGFGMGGWEVMLSEVDLMQYIGKDDKEGNEIYEDYILAWHYNEIDFADEYTKVGVIEYDEDLLGYVLNTYNEQFYPAINNDPSYDDGKIPLNELLYPEMDYKVIGNIYENPELLEARE